VFGERKQRPEFADVLGALLPLADLLLGAVSR
jgi:hypothetical protein